MRRSATSKSGAAWRRFQLSVAPGETEPAAALLETGARARSATQIQAGAATVCVYAPEPARHAAKRIRDLLARAQDRQLLRRARLSESKVSEQDWASSWKQFYRPFHIAAGLYIAPTWDKRFHPPRAARVLRLDPGMAFGTGQHPTTQLALNCLLAGLKETEIVLDIGCGSGILGLAAAQRGTRVYASDIDPLAIKAAKTNFAVNHVQAAAIRRARGIPLSFPLADRIVCNISACALARLAPDFAAHLKANGLLIVSGFSEGGRPSVACAMRRAGLHCKSQRASGAWIAQTYMKRRRMP